MAQEGPAPLHPSTIGRDGRGPFLAGEVPGWEASLRQRQGPCSTPGNAQHLTSAERSHGTPSPQQGHGGLALCVGGSGVQLVLRQHLLNIHVNK